MNAFGGMFATAGYHHQDPYSRMMAADPSAAAVAMGVHPAAAAHHAHAMHHHQYKVPRIYFKIPRVLPYKEQKEKFEGDDYFKKLARESEVRYTGYRDRPLHERQAKFQHACREGNIELSIMSNGFAFSLVWNVLENGYLEPHNISRVDFNKERGRVYIDSPLILNGCCLRWKGYVNLEKLDGIGSIRFDEDAARIEDAAMQQQIESYKYALREWDEQQQRHRAALQHARSSHLQAAAALGSSSGSVTPSLGGSSQQNMQQHHSVRN